MADGIMAPPPLPARRDSRPEGRGQNHYVYAIKSSLSQRIYFGQTSNIAKRIMTHNAGYVKSTINETPWELIAYQAVSTREEARWIEYNLKKSLGKRNKWIEQNRLGATASEGARITGIRI